MKSTKTRFAKKLKSIKAVDYLKQDRILQVLSAADGLVELLPKISHPIAQLTTESIRKLPWKLEEQSMTVSSLQQVVEEKEACGSFVGDKENVRPLVNKNAQDSVDRSEAKPETSSTSGADACRKGFGSAFRRPDFDSITLFDPKLLEAFERAVGYYRRLSQRTGETIADEEYVDDIHFPAISESEGRSEEEDDGGKDDNTLQEDPLLEFDARCPPGGVNSVVLYTTTLRGIRKTFDDCNKVRFLLDSFRVCFYERDVSMHREYREELRRITAATELPVLFVKGRCIGGAHRVLGLHEQGKLKALLEGVPVSASKRCHRCHGDRFLMCDGCRGSRKLVCEDGSRFECSICNENGLIVCPACSS